MKACAYYKFLLYTFLKKIEQFKCKFQIFTKVLLFYFYFFSEMEILQGEIKSLQAVKERLKQRVIDLEEELKKTKEEAEKMKAKFEEEVC